MVQGQVFLKEDFSYLIFSMFIFLHLKITLRIVKLSYASKEKLFFLSS